MAAPAAITAGAGLVSGLMGNKGAQKAANAAANDRRQSVMRASKLFDIMFNAVGKADQSGTFNPNSRMAAMESDGARGLATAQRVASADAMDSGFRAGDTPVQQGKDNLKLRYARDLASTRDSMKQQSFWDRLKAYGSIDTGMLQPGIQSAMYDESNARARMQNPAGFLGGISSALFPKAPAAQGAGRGVPAAGGGSGPFGFNPNYSLQLPVGGAGQSYWNQYFTRNK